MFNSGYVGSDEERLQYVVYFNKRLAQECRAHIVEHAGEVVRAGGAEQVGDLGVARGLLRDAWEALGKPATIPRGRPCVDFGSTA